MRPLSHCPFCGGTNQKITNAMGEWWVCCPDCKSSSNMFANQDDAINAWCRRPPDEKVTVRTKMKQAINIIFDGPPSHEAGRFVEVELDNGKSINVGQWIDREDGYWALRITDLPESSNRNEEIK